MPVLPLVGSIRVSPGLMRPDFSASSSMRTPMRSLTEPPGFMNSHLPRSSHGRSRPMRERRTIGVPPVVSRIESRIWDRAVMARAVYAGWSSVSLPRPRMERADSLRPSGINTLHRLTHGVVDAQISPHHAGGVKDLLEDRTPVGVVIDLDE